MARSAKCVFTIDCPFFPGFYNSMLEREDIGEYEIRGHRNWLEESKGIVTTDDDWELDWSARRDDVCNAFVKSFYTHSDDIVESVKMVSLESPTHYNYSTDRLVVKVKLVSDWRRQLKWFIKNHYRWLEKTIREEWSDRPGFWSHMSNDVDDWYGMCSVQMDERYIGEMLKYITIIHNDADNPHRGLTMMEEICESALDDICDCNYIIPTPELLEKHPELGK